ncbi:MAG: hypothetical protein R3A48_23500 [Polyangiales bacterium]
MRARSATWLLLVALLGCVRWEPLTTASLRASGTGLALQRIRVAGDGAPRELTVRGVRAGVLEGWTPSGRPAREDLSAVRRAWLRRPDELRTAALIAGVYAVIFTVSAAALIIDRR